MANPIIYLTIAATVEQDFTALLTPKDKALFVVLGNSPAHTALATTAQLDASAWRYVVQVNYPENLMPFLRTLNRDVAMEPFSPEPWFAVCISFNGIMEGAYADNDVDNIVPCFMLAETN